MDNSDHLLAALCISARDDHGDNDVHELLRDFSHNCRFHNWLWVIL